MMEENATRPPDITEAIPARPVQMSLAVPSAASMKASAPTALLHGLHLLLCVFSNAVYVSNEPGDDVLYPGQGFLQGVSEKGNVVAVQREGSFLVTIQAALLFGFFVSLHALMCEYLGGRDEVAPAPSTALGMHALMVTLYYFAQNDVWNAIDTSDIKFSMLGFTIFFNFLLALALAFALLQRLARAPAEAQDGVAC